MAQCQILIVGVLATVLRPSRHMGMQCRIGRDLHQSLGARTGAKQKAITPYRRVTGAGRHSSTDQHGAVEICRRHTAVILQQVLQHASGDVRPHLGADGPSLRQRPLLAPLHGKSAVATRIEIDDLINPGQGAVCQCQRLHTPIRHF